MVEDKKIINSKDILNAFGLNSSIFKDSLNFLEKEAEIKEEKFQKKLRVWESLFRSFYGEETDWSEPLPINMPKNNIHNLREILIKIIEQFHLSFHLLRKILIF